MAQHNETGKAGETAAKYYLISKGYRIVETNYKKRYGEIDIIVRKGDTLIFVEVKTRKNADFGRGSEFVNAARQKRMRDVASVYLAECEEPLSVRFDIIEVYMEKKRLFYSKPEIVHIENAFY